MPARRIDSDCVCTNEWSRDEPVAGLAAQRSLEGPAPPSAKLGHQVSLTTMFLTTTSCTSLSQSSSSASPLPTAPTACSVSWSSPCLLLAAPQSSPAHLGASSGPSSLLQFFYPPRELPRPLKQPTDIASQSQDAPSTSSTLPCGQALKLFSIQSCFPGDEYVKFSQSASLSWPLSLHRKSPCGKPKHSASSPCLLLLPAWTLGICGLCSEQLLYSCLWVARVVRESLLSMQTQSSAALVPAHQSLTGCLQPTELFRSYAPQSSLPLLLHTEKGEKLLLPGRLCPSHSHSALHPSQPGFPFT